MTVLITGATGFVGGDVAAALRRSGEEVRALVRDPARPAPGLAACGATSPTPPRWPPPAPAPTWSCTARPSPPTTSRGTSTGASTSTARALLEAARLAGVRRVVHLSSVAVYGVAAPSGPVDEFAPYGDGADPWAYYLRSKAEADRLALAASRDGLEVVVLRPGVIHGPGRAGVLVPALGGARGCG